MQYNDLILANSTQSLPFRLTTAKQRNDKGWSTF